MIIIEIREEYKVQNSFSTSSVLLMLFDYLQEPGQCGSGRLVCVGVDGVQQPHLSFPPGDNILTFLTCLETALSALSPPASLSPSLCSTTEKENTNNRSVLWINFWYITDLVRNCLLPYLRLCDTKEKHQLALICNQINYQIIIFPNCLTDFVNLYCRKFGNASLFKRKGSDVENQDADIEVKPHGKESVFKIIYKQVLKGENCTQKW